MRRSGGSWSEEKGKTERSEMDWNIGKEKWGGMERVGYREKEEVRGNGMCWSKGK